MNSNDNNENKNKQGYSKRRKNQFWLWLLVFFGLGLLIISVPFIIMFVNSPVAVEPVVATLPSPDPGPGLSPRPSLSPMPSPSPSPEPTPDPMEGMVHSQLTGLPIPEGEQYLRPMAVVINNHSNALPQSGLSSAEVIYEVLAEGSITRLLAIFQQLDAAAIGPVRSTREYFADLAMQYSAVLVHHGGSPTGYSRLRNLGIPNLDGMALEGTTFWRDPERRRVPRLFEHSSFTGAERLETTIEQRGIQRYLEEDADEIGFLFYQEYNEIPFLDMLASIELTPQPCLELIVPFSSSYPRRFVFDEERQMFAVYNVHGPHIDALLLMAFDDIDEADTEETEDDEAIEDVEEIDETEETEEINPQMFVTNVLVQNVRSRVVDAEGRREVTTIGSGTGYFATLGYIVEVRWERGNVASPTRWYFENGEPLLLNPGQTWINILQDSASIEVISGVEEEEQSEDEEHE